MTTRSKELADALIAAGWTLVKVEPDGAVLVWLLAMPARASA